MKLFSCCFPGSSQRASSPAPRDDEVFPEEFYSAEAENNTSATDVEDGTELHYRNLPEIALPQVTRGDLGSVTDNRIGLDSSLEYESELEGDTTTSSSSSDPTQPVLSLTEMVLQVTQPQNTLSEQYQPAISLLFHHIYKSIHDINEESANFVSLAPMDEDLRECFFEVSYIKIRLAFLQFLHEQCVPVYQRRQYFDELEKVSLECLLNHGTFQAEIKQLEGNIKEFTKRLEDNFLSKRREEIRDVFRLIKKHPNTTPDELKKKWDRLQFNLGLYIRILPFLNDQTRMNIKRFTLIHHRNHPNTVHYFTCFERRIKRENSTLFEFKSAAIQLGKIRFTRTQRIVKTDSITSQSIDDRFEVFSKPLWLETLKIVSSLYESLPTSDDESLQFWHTTFSSSPLEVAKKLIAPLAEEEKVMFFETLQKSVNKKNKGTLSSEPRLMLQTQLRYHNICSIVDLKQFLEEGDTETDATAPPGSPISDVETACLDFAPPVPPLSSTL